MRSDIEHLFLELISFSIQGTSFQYNDDKDTLFSLYGLASKHKVLPLIFDAIQIGSDADAKVIAEYEVISKNVYDQIISQAERSAAFIMLYKYLSSKNLHPVVMKGIVCRDLYINPEHRQSVDEDLIVEQDRFEQYHSALTDYGFELVNPSQDICKEYEVSYRHKDYHLYLEVHKLMFDPNSKSCSYLNDCFEHVLDNTVPVDIYGCKFRTLEYTDHLLYLILHAFKHFMYSGFGIRLVLDIVLFSKIYQEKIDWVRITKELSQAKALYFAVSLYKIGVKYLLPEFDVYSILPDWPFDEVDETNILEDILDGGVFGTSSIYRNHSSSITLRAVESGSDSTGKGILFSIFPSYEYMSKKYSYLEMKSFLLPVAWIQRIIQYLSENKHTKKNMKKPIEIGNKRVLLLKEYKIIS